LSADSTAISQRLPCTAYRARRSSDLNQRPGKSPDQEPSTGKTQTTEVANRHPFTHSATFPAACRPSCAPVQQPRRRGRGPDAGPVEGVLLPACCSDLAWKRPPPGWNEKRVVGGRSPTRLEREASRWRGGPPPGWNEKRVAPCRCPTAARPRSHGRLPPAAFALFGVVPWCDAHGARHAWCSTESLAPATSAQPMRQPSSLFRAKRRTVCYRGACEVDRHDLLRPAWKRADRMQPPTCSRA
jgi:hypothetical protein